MTSTYDCRVVSAVGAHDQQSSVVLTETNGAFSERLVHLAPTASREQLAIALTAITTSRGVRVVLDEADPGGTVALEVSLGAAIPPVRSSWIPPGGPPSPGVDRVVAWPEGLPAKVVVSSMFSVAWQLRNEGNALWSGGTARIEAKTPGWQGVSESEWPLTRPEDLRHLTIALTSPSTSSDQPLELQLTLPDGRTHLLGPYPISVASTADCADLQARITVLDDRIAATQRDLDKLDAHGAGGAERQPLEEDLNASEAERAQLQELQVALGCFP
ncbi:hypothetical protein [Kineococcus sp. SYSU DK001]|uniref:hypothetical protein n=1 Tax=Kineococcus sp. SYSU DK001 TaxID=3383122 RepID=UPI003D7CA3FE